MDLPCVVESFKTYDDCALVKTADIGQVRALWRSSIQYDQTHVFVILNATVLTIVVIQMIMVREPGDSTPDAVEYRHGLTPPMRDARKRRFRREPDLNVQLLLTFLTICWLLPYFLIINKEVKHKIKLFLCLGNKLPTNAVFSYRMYVISVEMFIFYIVHKNLTSTGNII